ncbi:MAG: hypothetical protein U9R34_01275, partial [Nanoarchaeota archaeon]|nr:hypothetical protein [Nanoarchaeota archaeon]
PFISLRIVKETFLATFSSNLKEICDVVIEAVNLTKQEVGGTRLAQNAKVQEILFNKKLKDAIRSGNLKQTNKYMKLIFNDKLLFSKLKDSQELTDVLENSLKKADIIATEAWHKFRKNFNNFQESPRFSAVKQYTWETKIRELKKTEGIFSDVDDEDIYVATEYLTYISERNSNLKFSGFDKNLIKSLNTLKQKLSLRCPEPTCLLFDS